MRNRLLLFWSLVFSFAIFLNSCKNDDLQMIIGNNKVVISILEDSTSYIFSQITCEINPKPQFEIEECGFCWDTNANVTIEKQHSSFKGLNSLVYVSVVEGLFPNKTYYVKAYLQNGEVIIYSNELTVKTQDARPTVSTTIIANIKGNRAESGGTVSSYEALFPVTQRGVCWAKSQNPTISDSLTNNGTGNGTFTSSLLHLDVETCYYVRAYAINSEGIIYGEQKSFTTLDGIPELTTDSTGNVLAASANIYGNFTDNDGLEVLEKGFCWNTNTNPTILNNHLVVSGNFLGIFSTNISGLSVNTTYYARAYIKNYKGTFYGNEIIFKTKDGLPILTTELIYDITNISASCRGTISSDGGFIVTTRGTCWSTNPNPTITDNYTIDGTGTGSFISEITGLNDGTIYYIRAYATNSIGTRYGNTISFTTNGGNVVFGDGVTDINGNFYSSVIIGDQEWMAENLKTTKYQNGDLIFDGSTLGDYSSLYEPRYWFAYNDDLSNIETYGRLYTWYAVTDSREICPDGWHIPSDSEWNNLQLYLGMSPNDIDLIGESDNGISAFLKETGTTLWLSPNAGATNSLGFGALPAGYRRRYNKDFDYLRERTFFWTSSAFNDVNSFYRSLSYDSPNITRSYNLKNYGFSVRCIKN